MDTKSLIPCLPDVRVTHRVGILAETLDYNHEMLNIPYMWQRTMGDGVKVVILDTGPPEHVDLKPEGGTSFIDGYLEDKNGHSTHCGGIIAAIANNDMGVAGISPDVQSYYGAVLNGDGSGSIDDIVSGIRWAVDEADADIISMSLGISAGFPKFRAMEAACNYAVDSGVAIFAAAGNESGNVGQPAEYDSVIAVAAANDKGEHANFSNTGPEVDFAAGGVQVYSTYLNNSYAKLSGTSMACPALAAVGALILADHRSRDIEMTPEELKDHIKRIAYDVGPVGFDEYWGHGIPIFRKGADLYDPDVPVENPLNPDIPEEPEAPDEPKKLDIRSDCMTWRLLRKYVERLDSELQDYPLEDALRSTIGSLTKELNKIDAQLHQD